MDADPNTGGIQNQREVTAGTPLTVDIVISNASEPVNGFEFDLDFDNSILSSTNVSEGVFPAQPTFGVEADTTSPM